MPLTRGGWANWTEPAGPAPLNRPEWISAPQGLMDRANWTPKSVDLSMLTWASQRRKLKLVPSRETPGLQHLAA
jgi:hypothetical protein